MIRWIFGGALTSLSSTLRFNNWVHVQPLYSVYELPSCATSHVSDLQFLSLTVIPRLRTQDIAFEPSVVDSMPRRNTACEVFKHKQATTKRRGLELAIMVMDYSGAAPDTTRVQRSMSTRTPTHVLKAPREWVHHCDVSIIFLLGVLLVLPCRMTTQKSKPTFQKMHRNLVLADQPCY